MYIKYTEMRVILPHTVADSKGGFKCARLLRVSRSLDICRALNSVILVQSSLEDYRANVEQLNHQRFESAKICEPLDIELEVKKNRICGRQIMRDNVQAEGSEDYLRKSITVC